MRKTKKEETKCLTAAGQGAGAIKVGGKDETISRLFQGYYMKNSSNQIFDSSALVFSEESKLARMPPKSRHFYKGLLGAHTDMLKTGCLIHSCT